MTDATPPAPGHALSQSLRKAPESRWEGPCFVSIEMKGEMMVESRKIVGLVPVTLVMFVVFMGDSSAHAGLKISDVSGSITTYSDDLDPNSTGGGFGSIISLSNALDPDGGDSGKSGTGFISVAGGASVTMDFSLENVGNTSTFRADTDFSILSGSSGELEAGSFIEIPTPIFTDPFEFTLQESVAYSLSGEISGLFANDAHHTIEIMAFLGEVGGDTLFYLNRGWVAAEAGELEGSLDNPFTGSATGVLEPGTYTFGWRLGLSDDLAANANTVGKGFIELTLQSQGSSAVPEPSSIALLGIGLAGSLTFGFRRRRGLAALPIDG